MVWVSPQNSASNQIRFNLWQLVCTQDIATEEPNSIFLKNSLRCLIISYIKILSIKPCIVVVVVVTASSSCHVTPTINLLRTIVIRQLFKISPRESMNLKAIMLG